MIRWCCHWPSLYTLLPLSRVLNGFCEFVLGLTRLVLFFSPLPPNTASSPNATTSHSQTYGSTYVAAFAIDWISSIVPTLVGLFVALLVLILLYKFFGYCWNSYSRQNPQHQPHEEINTEGWFRSVWDNKAIRRFIALDCNCPCYRSRPKRRFQLHLVYFIVTFVFRIVAISMYGAAISTTNRAGDICTVIGITFVFLAIGFSFDVYHYCVW